jgi:hypothetical protein
MLSVRLRISVQSGQWRLGRLARVSSGEYFRRRISVQPSKMDTPPPSPPGPDTDTPPLPQIPLPLSRYRPPLPLPRYSSSPSDTPPLSRYRPPLPFPRHPSDPPQTPLRPPSGLRQIPPRSPPVPQMRIPLSISGDEIQIYWGGAPNARDEMQIYWGGAPYARGELHICWGGAPYA